MTETETFTLSTRQVLAPTWNRSDDAGWADVLAGFPLFKGVSRRRLRKLAREATVAEFAPGDIVVSNPESADSLYIILGGTAKVLGKPAARPLKTGGYFGELALLDDKPRSATVVADSELHVLKLPRESFLKLARDNSGIALTMMRNLGSQVRRLETLPTATS
jgi:CRP-like cAMP-binding protein